MLKYRHKIHKHSVQTVQYQIKIFFKIHSIDFSVFLLIFVPEHFERKKIIYAK
jgi:hypothetical protein